MTLKKHLLVFVFRRRKLIRRVGENIFLFIQASTVMCCCTPSQNINEFISHYVEKIMLLHFLLLRMETYFEIFYE